MRITPSSLSWSAESSARSCLLALFDWALIIFSAIEGARLIADSVHLPSTGTTILVVALALFGIIVQSAMFRRSAARGLVLQCRK